MLHLDLLEHGGGLVLKKLLISHASLKLFWESLNSMVICLKSKYAWYTRLIIKLSYDCVEYYEKFNTW